MQGCAKCNNIRNVIITCTLQGKIIGKRFREMTPANRGKLRREIRVPISNTARLSLCVYVGNSEKVICPAPPSLPPKYHASPSYVIRTKCCSFGGYFLSSRTIGVIQVWFVGLLSRDTSKKIELVKRKRWWKNDQTLRHKPSQSAEKREEWTLYKCFYHRRSRMVK